MSFLASVESDVWNQREGLPTGSPFCLSSERLMGKGINRSDVK